MSGRANGTTLAALIAALTACSSPSSHPNGVVGVGANDAGASADGANAMMANGMCLMYAYRHPDGVCVCAIDHPDICPTSCVDLMTDDDNCGACGHACPATSACAVGVCGSPTVTAVEASPGCGSITLFAASGTLTWADKGHGTILRGATGGATIAPTTIASGESAPSGVLVRGATTFWLTAVDLPPGSAADAGVDGGGDAGLRRTVIRAAANGTVGDVYGLTAAVPGPSNLYDGAIHGFTVSEDGATVFFSTGTKVQKVPASGGTPTDVAVMDNPGLPVALAVHGDLLAFSIDILGGFDVVLVSDVVAHCWHDDPMGLPLDINCNRLNRGQGAVNLQAVGVDATGAYWVDGPNLHVGALSLTIPSENDTVVSTDSPIASFALAGGQAYFTSFDSSAPTSGLVQKVATTARFGTPTPLARNLDGPGSIALDGKTVFWSNADCEIQSTLTGE